MPIILSGQFSCHLLLKQKLLREEVVLEQKTVYEKYMKSGFIFITDGAILTSISFRNLDRSWERLIKANKEAHANYDRLKLDNGSFLSGRWENNHVLFYSFLIKRPHVYELIKI